MLRFLLAMLLVAGSLPAVSGATITVRAAGTPQQMGAELRTIAAARTEGRRLIELGPGRFDLATGLAFVRGTTTLRGAGRELTEIVGRGEMHSALGCMIEIAGPDVVLEDLTLRWEGGRGAQSQVVGYGNKAAPSGAKLTLRRCHVVGGMFGLYSWSGFQNRIRAEDCTFTAARFPVCAGRSSGANAQFVELVRCLIVCDASLHDTGRAQRSKSEVYRTCYGIYARGGRVTCNDCTFEITGDRDMAAVLGVGVPPGAAHQTRVELVRPIFRLNGNGAGRVAETERLNRRATITVDGVPRE